MALSIAQGLSLSALKACKGRSSLHNFVLSHGLGDEIAHPIISQNHVQKNTMLLIYTSHIR